jgi:hypothetical protein
VGTRADFLLGAILAGAGARVQIQPQQPGKWSLGREHGAARMHHTRVGGCAVMDAAMDAVMQRESVCLATTSSRLPASAKSCVGDGPWVIGRYEHGR